MVEQPIDLTVALEDYLETIYLLIRENKFARVKDIANARGVRAGSVTPAMKRLEELGLIRYVRNEYIDLTSEGMKEALRVNARHQVLTRLFQEVLGLPNDQAVQNACAMEHNMTPEAMSRVVRFFEFLHLCPDGKKLLDLFHSCNQVNDSSAICSRDCSAYPVPGRHRKDPPESVSTLKPGESGIVMQVNGKGAIRQRLLDMGILPDVTVEVERVAPSGDPIWIKLHGFQLSLRKREADSVVVDRSSVTGRRDEGIVR